MAMAFFGALPRCKAPEDIEAAQQDLPDAQAPAGASNRLPSRTSQRVLKNIEARKISSSIMW